MSTRVLMPKLGLTMTEGSIVRWIIAEGQNVNRGEPLIEVMTDKATTEMESPGTGVLRKVLVPEGVTVPCGTLVGIIAAEDEDIDRLLQEDTREAAAGAISSVEPSLPKEDSGVDQAKDSPSQVKASPAVRRLARQLGVDIEKVCGTGAGGCVTEEDVSAAVATPACAAPGPTHESRSTLNAQVPGARGGHQVSPVFISVEGMRRTIADRMARSASETARVTLVAEAQMEEIKKLKDDLSRTAQERAGVGLTYTDFILCSTARALKDHPEANSSFLRDRIEIKPDINIGIAVDIPGGLVVPVIRRADKKTLFEIAVARRRLVESARAGTLSPDDLQGGTFTITNLGGFGVDFFTPIINLPESVILGVGRIAKRPVVVDTYVEPRLTVFLSLVFDHRVIDGAPAARLLNDIVLVLEHPSTLVT